VQTKKIYKVLILLLVSLQCQILLAEEDVIQFPDEELARESVLPQFDKPDVVKVRNVITKGKIELSPFLGIVTTEPIYGPLKFGANLSYHWNEDSVIALNFAKFSGGLNTQYTEDLKKNYYLDFNRAPKQNFSAFVNYELQAYYGKISFTKQGVMNLITAPLFGVGVINYEHKSYPGLNVGIGQKFYYSKSVALRVDFKVQYAQGPSPFLYGHMKTGPTVPDPTPAPGDFEDKWTFHNVIEIGASFLF
jgi:outer membrane beta-barrel protein